VSEILRTNDELRRALPKVHAYWDDSVLDQTLLRLVSYQPKNAAEAVRRAQVLVLLADMNVVRARRSHRYREYAGVLEQYAVAYRMLRDAGLEQAALGGIFAPAVPIVLPAYYSSSLEANDSGAAPYVDVSFEISDRGRSAAIEVTGTSENLPRGDRRELVRMIDEGIFRPVFVDGQALASAPVTVRYYLSEDPAQSLRQGCAQRGLAGYCLEQDE
jgi:hypothetical protein